MRLDGTQTGDATQAGDSDPHLNGARRCAGASPGGHPADSTVKLFTVATDPDAEPGRGRDPG